MLDNAIGRVRAAALAPLGSLNQLATLELRSTCSSASIFYEYLMRMISVRGMTDVKSLGQTHSGTMSYDTLILETAYTILFWVVYPTS